MPWSITASSQTNEFTVIDDETQQETIHYDVIKTLPSGSSTRARQKEVEYVSSFYGDHFIQYHPGSSASANHHHQSNNSFDSPTALLSNFFMPNSTAEASQSALGNNSNLLGKQQALDSITVLVKDRFSNEQVVIKPLHLRNDDDFDSKFEQVSNIIDRIITSLWNQFEKLKALSRTSYGVVRVNRLYKWNSASMPTPEDTNFQLMTPINDVMSPSTMLSVSRKRKHCLAFISMDYYAGGSLFQLLTELQKQGKRFSILNIYNFLIQVVTTLCGRKTKQNKVNDSMLEDGASDIEEYAKEILTTHGALTSHNILTEFEQTGFHKFYLSNFSFMRQNQGSLSLSQKNGSILMGEDEANEKLSFASINDMFFFPAPPDQLNSETKIVESIDDRWAIGILLYQLITGKTSYYNEKEQMEILRSLSMRTIELSKVKEELENYLQQGDFAFEQDILNISPVNKKRKKQLEEELSTDAKALVDLAISLLDGNEENRPSLSSILENEVVVKYAKLITDHLAEKENNYAQLIENDALIVEQKKKESQNSVLPQDISQKDYLSLQYFLAYHKEKGIDERWDGNFYRQERIGQESILSILEMTTNHGIKSFVLSFIRNLRLNVLFDFRQEVNLPTDYKMLKTVVLNLLAVQNKKKSVVSFKHVRSIMGQSLPMVPELLLVIVLLVAIEFLLESNFEYYTTCTSEYTSKVDLFTQIQSIEGMIQEEITKHEIESSQFRIATRLSKKENDVRFFIEKRTPTIATGLIDSLTNGQLKGNLVLSLLRFLVSNCMQKERRWVLVGNEGKMEGKMFGFEDIFKNKKKRNRGSLNAEFKGDYINANGNIQLQLAFSKTGDKEVLFADRVDKINDKCKIQRRIFLISDLAIYNIDQSSSKYQVKRRVPISDIESIYVSTYTDGYFVIKVPNSYDFLYCSWRKTEILTAIQKERNIPVIISNRFTFNPGKGGIREVVFVEDAKSPKANVKLTKKEYIVTVRPPEADPINFESVSAIVYQGSEQKEVILDPYDTSTFRLPINSSYRIRFVFYVNENLNCFLDESIKGDNETVFQLLLGQFHKSDEKVVLVTDVRQVKDYFGLKSKKTQCTMKITDTERQTIHVQSFVIEYDM